MARWRQRRRKAFISAELYLTIVLYRGEESTSIINRKSQIAVLRPRGRPLRFCGPGRGLGCVGPGRVQEENARGVVWVFLGALNRCFGPTEISRIRIRIRVALLIAQQRFWALATVQS